LNKASTAGIFAILFWSTNIAFSRSLAEQMGVFTSGSVLFILGGLLSLGYQIRQAGGIKSIFSSSKKYLLVCGMLFITNTVTLQMAVGLSTSRDQTIVVGLINYLWTVMSLLFSTFLLKKQVKPWLPLGIFLALGGIFLATTGGDLPSLMAAFQQPGTLAVYALALCAALTWGFYSNLGRRWASSSEGGSVPLFLLLSGLAMGILRLTFSEQTRMLPSTYLELAYMVIFPTMLAYIFWDLAMRKGRMITVVSLSYFIPLFSTIISSLKLGVRPGPAIWISALLLIGGAWISKSAIPD
jgi:drug/metabolite transporter (DMT)-like permease